MIWRMLGSDPYACLEIGCSRWLSGDAHSPMGMYLAEADGIVPGSMRDPDRTALRKERAPTVQKKWAIASSGGVKTAGPIWH